MASQLGDWARLWRWEEPQLGDPGRCVDATQLILLWADFFFFNRTLLLLIS